MANYLIVGAGASGLYTAYKLLTSGKIRAEDTVQIREWGERSGGRIFTFYFPEPQEWKEQGLYVEAGGMRFAADPSFPNLPSSGCEGHGLVQSMILQVGLKDKVRDFQQSNNRLYYFRLWLRFGASCEQRRRPRAKVGHEARQHRRVHTSVA